MGNIDIIVLIVILVSVLISLYRGLACELMTIINWVLASFAALYGYVFMQPFMLRFISDPTLAGISGACIVALVVLIIMTLINAKICSHLRKSPLNGLDKILGLLFGVFRAVLLIAIVYFLLSAYLLSNTQIKKWEQENVTMPFIQQAAKTLKPLIPEKIAKDIFEYQQKRLAEIQNTITPEKAEKADSSSTTDTPEKETVDTKTIKPKKNTKKEPSKSKKKNSPTISPKKEKTVEETGYSADSREGMDDLIKNEVLIEELQ